MKSFSLFTLFSLVAWWATALPAADIAVPGDFEFIQDALDAAQPGDVITVAPGIYVENLIVEKPVTLQSTDPNNLGVVQQTIIDGDAFDSVVIFAAFTSTDPNEAQVLQGFTITNGDADTGGGILVESGSRAVIRNCIILDNFANDGAGLHAVNASPIITGTTFQNNIATQQGGGMFFGQSSPIISNATIVGNLADTGGGICGDPNVNLILSGSTLSGNQAFDGAGLCLTNSQFIFRNNTIAVNRAENTAGGFLLDNTTGQMNNTILTGNLGAASADAFLVGGGSVDTNFSILSSDPNTVGLANNSNFNTISGIVRQNPGFFVNPTFNDNGTPDDFTDDTFAPGNLRLAAGSPGIDAGDPNFISTPGATDLGGSPRVINNRVDIGAFETSGQNMRVLALQCTPGPNPDPNVHDDRLFLSGFLTGDLEQIRTSFNDANSVTITVGNLTQTIAFDDPFAFVFPNAPVLLYRNPATTIAFNVVLLNLINGRFIVFGTQCNLDGLASPVPVSISFGNFLAAELVNLPALSFCFQHGIRDALQIDQVQIAGPGAAFPGRNVIVIRGKIATLELHPNLVGALGTLFWGDDFSVDFPPLDQDFRALLNDRFIFQHRGPIPAEPTVTVAFFDFTNCTFVIVVRNATITTRTGAVPVELILDGFDQVATFNFRTTPVGTGG